jgi:hypothetical protein
MTTKLFKQALIASAAALVLAGCGSGQQEPAAVVAKPAVKKPAVKAPAAAVENPVVVEQRAAAAEQSPTLADDISAPAAAEVR